MAAFTMPALGADMETGKVIAWHVKPGDTVHAGDVVAVVETHKGAIDVECFLEGVIENLVPLNTELPVGAAMATVRSHTDLMPHKPVIPTPEGGRIRVSPAARHRASALGISLADVQPTGAEGAITLADVLRVAPHSAPAAQKKGGFDPVQMRQAIALAMARSKREIPHYYLGNTLDFGAAHAWLKAWNSQHDVTNRLLPAVLLLKATARAIESTPQLNGFYENGEFRPAKSIHVGWAIALRGGGLVAPAIHDTNQKSLVELMAALSDLVKRTRTGGLRSSELTDPTITVTSLGDRGADSVFGVIYPPQVAIIGFGREVQRPWVADGQVVVRPLVAASLAGDHRANDGHLGGQLLAAIDLALQSPTTL